MQSYEAQLKHPVCRKSEDWMSGSLQLRLRRLDGTFGDRLWIAGWLLSLDVWMSSANGKIDDRSGPARIWISANCPAPWRSPPARLSLYRDISKRPAGDDRLQILPTCCSFCDITWDVEPGGWWPIGRSSQASTAPRWPHGFYVSEGPVQTGPSTRFIHRDATYETVPHYVLDTWAASPPWWP